MNTKNYQTQTKSMESFYFGPPIPGHEGWGVGHVPRVILWRKLHFPFPSEVSCKYLIEQGQDFVSTSFCWDFVWFEFVFVFIFHFLFCLVGEGHGQGRNREGEIWRGKDRSGRERALSRMGREVARIQGVGKGKEYDQNVLYGKYTFKITF